MSTTCRSRGPPRPRPTFAPHVNRWRGRFRAERTIKMTTDIAVRNAPSQLAIFEHDQHELGDFLGRTLGGGALALQDLDRIKMPTGGSLTFTVPTASGDEQRRSLTGVVLDVTRHRAFWPGAFSGTNAPPECSSADGVTGVGDPGGTCACCPHAFRENGKAAACRLTCECLLILDSDLLPTILVASPTSVRPVAKFLLSLAKRGLHYHDVLASFGLERATSNSGIAFARLVPKMLRALEPHERARMREIVAALGFGGSAPASTAPPPVPTHAPAVVIPEHALVDPGTDDDVPPPAASDDDTDGSRSD